MLALLGDGVLQAPRGATPCLGYDCSTYYSIKRKRRYGCIRSIPERATPSPSRGGSDGPEL
eukprot:6041885-Prymnesium_polylepis.1